jgi:hypothetical protein
MASPPLPPLIPKPTALKELHQATDLLPCLPATLAYKKALQAPTNSTSLISALRFASLLSSHTIIEQNLITTVQHHR